MNSRLSVTHLIYHFLLFVLTVLLLLTLIRAGFNLWQLGHIDNISTLVSSFIQGFRFDFATVGILLLPAIVIIPLLAMFGVTVGLARILSPLWLILSLAFILVMELITPYFLYTEALRPDMHAISNVGDMTTVTTEIRNQFLIPLALGVLLLLLMLYAFWARMETNRFLRFPVAKLPALLLSIIGLVLCVIAARSNINPTAPALGPDAALISQEPIVNEISMNSAFKTLHGLYTQSDFLKNAFKIPNA